MHLFWRGQVRNVSLCFLFTSRAAEMVVAAACKQRALAFELKFKSFSAELLSCAAASAVSSGTVWKWRNAYLAFYAHIPRKMKHHTEKGTRSIFTQWFQLPRERLHDRGAHCAYGKCSMHCSCVQYDAMATITQSNLPDRRLSIACMDLKRRAKLQTGDTMSPWSRPIRIVTLKAVSLDTRSVLRAGNCLSLNAAWLTIICVLDDNYTGCEDHRRRML